MRCNPGGHLAPEEVVGREALLRAIWSALEQQSVLLTAERRMGKTSLLFCMKDKPHPAFQVIYRDLEGLRSPQALVNATITDLQACLPGVVKAEAFASQVQAAFRRLGLTEVAGVRIPEDRAAVWPEVLEQALKACELPPGERLVLLWDEFPLFLMNLMDQGQDATVRQILDLLRSARQTNSSLRFVLTGSIGLHNVLHRLREGGYRNSPVNDVRSIDVPPLEAQDGAGLARALIEGEALEIDPAEGVDAVAFELQREVSGIPFLIHQVVASWKDRRVVASSEAARATVDKGLRDPSMGWDLAQYRYRIDTHYPERDRPLALGVLDQVAGGALPYGELREGLRPLVSEGAEETLRHLLRLLASDHYIHQREDGRYGFRLDVVRRWWTKDRNL